MWLTLLLEEGGGRGGIAPGRVVHYENNQTTSNLFISRGSYRSYCSQIVLLHSVFSMLCSFYIIVTRVTRAPVNIPLSLMLIGTSMQFPGGRQYCSSTRGWRKLFWEDKEELAGFGRKVKWEVIGKSFSATRDVTCRLQAKGHWHLHSIETAGHRKIWKCFSSPMPESWWGLLWTTKGGLFLHNRYLGSAWE